VIVWGSDESGGSCSIEIYEYISSGVKTIFSNRVAFAALKDDGSVITWGNQECGGDHSNVAHLIGPVQDSGK